MHLKKPRVIFNRAKEYIKDYEAQVMTRWKGYRPEGDTREAIEGLRSSRHGMSKFGEEFMDGVLHHLPSVLAFTTPIPNIDWQGTSMERPILSTISLLTNLQELYLRHCLLIGSIPEYIVHMCGMKNLDLSFNKLTGFFNNNSISLDIPIWAFTFNNRKIWHFMLISTGHSDPAKLELKVHDAQQLSTDELQKRQMEIKVLGGLCCALMHPYTCVHDSDTWLHCVITIIRYTSMYRVACAWIVGKASQNNPVVQKQVLELGALPKLMTMVKSSVLEEEAIKALYVVSTIIRNNLNGLKLFYFEGGDLMLKGILSNATADVRLRRRSVSLVADMAEYQLEYTSKWDVPFFCNCALVRLLIDLTASGSFSLLKSSLQILNWVFINFLRPAKNLKKDGSWALVTGPTDGIGKAFAFQLASKGLNLVLVGRNLAKLNDVSDSIRTKFKQTQIKVVVVDFSCDLDHGIGRIKETVAGIDVRVLINNVGVCYPYARFFHEVDDKLMFNFIKVNVEGTTKVTNVVLTGMIKRKKGAIVK
ncbi:uncharacterized protein LOC111913074 [Lactuca sativa]|uniref:uncharacterized protein LOC111913074 n=1 Tax=Lactuca sativa TaxID=4236 RepID=UPI0022AF82AE|nr:uncharacterized protein LOC111913074 [Lactuca sativa]